MSTRHFISALALVLLVTVSASAATARFLIYWGHYADMELPPVNPCQGHRYGQLDTQSVVPFALPDAPGGVFFLYRCVGKTGTHMAGYEQEVVRFFQTDARYPAPGFGIPGETVPPEMPSPSPAPTDCSGYPGFVPGRGGGCVPANHPEAR
jgi:hypothetical protein